MEFQVRCVRQLEMLSSGRSANYTWLKLLSLQVLTVTPSNILNEGNITTLSQGYIPLMGTQGFQALLLLQAIWLLAM